MDNLILNSKLLAIAILEGIIPALLWLWFWLKEDQENPEPKGVIAFCFFIGMILVIFTIPIQRFVQNLVDSENIQLILWAGIEELVKYLAVVLLLYKTKYLKRPINWAIYMITIALGFAAFENILFLAKPLLLQDATVGLLTGQLRFLGSTLLHAVSSGLIGIAIGLSFYLNKVQKKLYLLTGILFAVVLHSGFNFFIIKSNGSDLLKVFAFLWVATIINLLLFEKLRRISGDN